MPQTDFLDRQRIWSTISRLKKHGGRVLAAIAYFGKNGANFLPLSRGDTLVVDLSLSAVRQGVSDPREIKKLIDKGVKVYTRSSLHAKIIVIGRTAIIGSANVSENARYFLDEASVATTIPSVVRSAKEFIRDRSSELVLPRYLDQCIAEYRPPRFKAARTLVRPNIRKRRAKLWFIGGLQFIDPRQDRPLLDKFEEEDAARLKSEVSEVNWIRYGYKPRFFTEIVENNWIVDCTRTGGGRRVVGAPARVIRKREYVSTSGKKYYLLMLERRKTEEHISLTRFRNAIKTLAPKLNDSRPKTQPLLDGDVSDRVLRLWTASGRFRRKTE